MKTPIQRIRIGATVLGGIYALAVVGYHFLDDRSWLDAAYMVIITISTVGFGEQSNADWEIKILTILLIVFGLSAATYTMGGLVQMLTEGEIEKLRGHRRIAKGIENLSRHVIICGFGRMGQILADELSRQKKPFVVIENNQDRIIEAIEREYLAIEGDATEESVLLSARVDHAKTLVSSLPSDAGNVFITLSARNLNNDLQILARAEEPATEQKLKQAGADRVVMPANIGAQRLAWIITRPSSANLLDLVADRSKLDVEIDEIIISSESSLIGKTVREAEAPRRHRLLIVTVKRADGEMVFNPDADHIFLLDDTLVVMGHMEDIERFKVESKV